MVDRPPPESERTLRSWFEAELSRPMTLSLTLIAVVTAASGMIFVESRGQAEWVLILIPGLAVAALLGTSIQRALQGSRRIWRILAGLAAGSVAIAAAAVFFLYEVATHPATDDELFAGKNQIKVVISDPGSSGKTDTATVLLTYPHNVRKYNDFLVTMTVSSTSDILPGEYRASLSSPGPIAIRAQVPCDRNPQGEAIHEACTAVSKTTNVMTFIWDVRNSQEGGPFFTISIPKVGRRTEEWSATLTLGGEQVREMVPGTCRSDAVDGWDLRGNFRDCGKPVLLTRTRPSIQVSHDEMSVTRLPGSYEDVNLDLANNSIGFPVEFDTTIGFSLADFAWLSLGGTVLAGMLGSGWLWKLLDRAVKKPPPTNAQIGPTSAGSGEA